MSEDQQPPIERHLTEEELDGAIDEAEQANEPRLVRRLCFIKNLYAGDAPEEAATRVGMSQSTSSRWRRAWNEHGVDGLRPSFGGGRPPKLSDAERTRLKQLLQAEQPWTTPEVKLLIEEEFDVSYSQRHLARLLKSFDMSYAIPRPESPNRPDDADEQLEERLNETLSELTDDEDEEDDVVTDGGTVVGFLDEAWPQPTDNSQRVWAFGTPRLAKQMPSFDDAVLGFYAILGTSVVACKPDASQTSFAEFFERIREQNPVGRILLVCDNFSSHFAAETNDAAAEYDITRVRLPPYSPHLNPIEQLWKSLKRDLSPLSAESGEEFRALIRESFQKFSERLSFATGWIGRFLDIQRL